MTTTKFPVYILIYNHINTGEASKKSYYLYKMLLSPYLTEDGLQNKNSP